MTQPTFQILAKADVSPELDRQMEKLFQLAFNEEEIDQGRDPAASSLEDGLRHQWFALGWVDSELVTQLALLTREITVGSQKVWVVGVGGVATHPTWRHQGFASGLLRLTEDFVRKEINVPFGLLVCAPETRPLYERAGWRYVADELYFQQNDMRRRMQTPVMIFPFSQQDWPVGEIDLCGSSW